MATYYDLIYHHLVDYESQSDYLEKIFEKHSEKKISSILDVACGTGNFSFILAERGYKVTGIDLSNEMIEVAQQKKSAKSANPEFFNMDMRRLNLSRKYDAAVVLFGGFGYLLSYLEVKDFLSSTKKYLGGENLLIFEFWQNSAISPQALSPSGHKTWERFEDEKNGRLLIRLDTSKYDPQFNLLTAKFDFYVLENISKTISDFFSETHILRIYSISEMRHLLEENNYKSIAFYDGSIIDYKKNLRPATQNSFRVLAVSLA